MAIDPGDSTILVNFSQGDKWTLTHVLMFYYIMWNGLDWYWAVLIAYLWKGFEVTEGVVSPSDGLIVDPLQATMAIVVFLVLRHYGLARASIQMPRLRADKKTYEWLAKMLYWVIAMLTNGNHLSALDMTGNTPGGKWIACLIAMFAINVGLDKHTHGCPWRETLSVTWAPLLYIISFTISYFAVSAIPYNPFYASLWFHIPAFAVQAWLVASPRWHHEEDQGSADTVVTDSLLPLQSLFTRNG